MSTYLLQAVCTARNAPSAAAAPSVQAALLATSGHADPQHLQALFDLIAALRGTVEGAWAGRHGDTVVLASVPGDCHPDELAQRLTRLEGYRCIQLTALPDLGRLRDGPDTAGAAHPRRLVGTLAAALGTGHALVV